jgi:hypothetical protein
MWHHRINIAERRLVGRESAWQWEFAHEPGERWVALLLALAVIAGIFLAFQEWLYGATMLR